LTKIGLIIKDFSYALKAMLKFHYPKFLILMLIPVVSPAAITLTSPSSDWNPVNYPGVVSDSVTDEGTDERNLVGRIGPTSPDTTPIALPAIYKAYENGNMFFRTRIGGDKKSDLQFGEVLWFGVSINGITNDPDETATDLDVFIGVDGKGGQLGVYTAGTGANISPGTTTIGAASWSEPLDYTTNTNIHLAPVTIDGLVAPDTDLDSNGTDYFVSFTLSFSNFAAAVFDITGVTINEGTGLGLIVSTSTQVNSLNKDLNGVDGTPASGSTWDSLGVISPLASIPEPAEAGVLLGFIGLALILARHRNRLKSGQVSQE